MEITDLLTSERVVSSLRAPSKKQALQELSRRAAEFTGLHERTIFDVLLERERLGTTGVGSGIAIPHGKLSGLEELLGVFARLEKPVDFDAVDEQPVDLIFLLLAPEAAGADHLKALLPPEAAPENLPHWRSALECRSLLALRGSECQLQAPDFKGEREKP